jgi:hypothetical protein
MDFLSSLLSLFTRLKSKELTIRDVFGKVQHAVAEQKVRYTRTHKYTHMHLYT